MDSVIIVEVYSYTGFDNLQLDCTCETSTEPNPTSTPRPTPTLAPAENVQAQVEDVTVSFEQSRTIPSDDEIDFEDIVSTWFDAFYNGRRRRSLQGLPGIRNMNCHIRVKEQSASGLTNVVTFIQSLTYDAVVGSSRSVEKLVLEPWKDEKYNTELGKILAMELPRSFKDIRTPISVPTVDPVDPEEPVETSSSSAALYALSALALIPVAAVIGYVVYVVYRRQRKQGEEREIKSKDDMANGRASAGGSSGQQSADHLLNVGSRDETHDETDDETLAKSLVALIDHIEQASAGGSSGRQSADHSGDGSYDPDVKDQCRSVPKNRRGPVLAEAVPIESRRSDPPVDP